MKQRMSFKNACDLVDDDLPDGAYFALAHELAGLEYGEGFAELAEESIHSRRTWQEIAARSPQKTHQCYACKKWLRGEQGLRQHQQAAHPEMKPKTRERHVKLARREN